MSDAWISVEERLPEGDQDVIVVTKNCEHYRDGTACYARVYKFCRGKFYGWGREDTGVTHWMPLPAPPYTNG